MKFIPPNNGIQGIVLKENLDFLQKLRVNLQLYSKEKKADLTSATTKLVKTGKKLVVSRFAEIYLVHSIETLMLERSYEKNFKTSMFFPENDFHFTEFGVNCLNTRLLESLTPTYQKFADIWKEEWQLMQRTAKAEGVYINFMQDYLRKFPSATSKNIASMLSLERNKHLNKTIEDNHTIEIDFLKNHPASIFQLVKIWHELLGKIWAPHITFESMVQRFHENLNDRVLPITFVAHAGSRPVGMCSLRATEGTTRLDLTPWLGSFVVDRAYQSCGIGRILMNAATNKARDLGFNKIYLFAFDSTIPHYYKLLGWEKVGTEEIRGHNVVLMGKML